MRERIRQREWATCRPAGIRARPWGGDVTEATTQRRGKDEAV
ncbi:MAG TPA: hypothetical protein VII19_12025 [Acidimicrobiales bacterium]|nr:hypothetical protein [Acidimicrobiales bacterium]